MSSTHRHLLLDFFWQVISGPPCILEELNNQIHETLATVIPNVLRLARENLMKRARLFLQMKGGQFEHML
jgi:hypothetical protein